MTDYEAPPPEVAEFVHQKRAEWMHEFQRLDGASTETAWSVVTDPSEPVAARLQAIEILRRNKDPRIPDLILSLFDEPDASLWRSAILSFRPDDPRIRQRLRERTESGDRESAAVALFVLALMRDASTLEICKEWLAGSLGQRRAAVSTLKALGTEQAVQLLKARWTDTLPTDEDRHTLALFLMECDHAEAVAYVDQLATKVTENWCVQAATSIYRARKDQGLRHMLNILQTGTLEAKQRMVYQISKLAGHLPHEFTADGIHEARLWVEAQLANAS